jgi:uncharacterized protein
MILKLIIFAIVALLIYKFFGGKLPSLRRDANAKRLEDDTLIECQKCGTYVTTKEALVSEGAFFCSRECRGY